MIGGRPAVVVDTNVFGAELTRRGAALADAYRGHVEGRSLFISVTVAEISAGLVAGLMGVSGAGVGGGGALSSTCLAGDLGRDEGSVGNAVFVPLPCCLS